MWPTNWKMTWLQDKDEHHWHEQCIRHYRTCQLQHLTENWRVKLSINRFSFPFCRKVAMKGERIRCPSNSIGRFLMQRWVQNLAVAIYSKWVPRGSFHACPHASNTHPLHETRSALGYLKKYFNSLITKLENLSAISKDYAKVTVDRHTINL